MSNSFFEGRTAYLVSMHGKEQVIAPVLENDLGLKIKVLSDVNTDELGTFSGEIERPDSQLNTLKLKAQKAFENPVVELVIASEGAFGPHPSAFFITANCEMVYLYDKQNNLECVGEYVSTETNYAKSDFQSVVEAVSVAEKAGFPSHAMIVSYMDNEQKQFIKGITEIDELKKACEKALQNQEAIIETDMRAHLNPTRMLAIKQATIRLADKLNSFCPECHFPGFSITSTLTGLPCENCSLPTRLTRAVIKCCTRCNFTTQELVESAYADPMYCDNCNP